MEKPNIVYVINHLTDKEGNPKGFIGDPNMRYIPYVVKVGRSAVLPFVDGDTDKCIKTSTVEEVAYIHGLLVIKTMNTVYWLKPVSLEGE